VALVCRDFTARQITGRRAVERLVGLGVPPEAAEEWVRKEQVRIDSIPQPGTISP
jgi:hypothetical protein